MKNPATGDALATELAYGLRYKRHHHKASGLSSPVGNKRPTTHRMPEYILAREEKHAGELHDWLEG